MWEICGFNIAPGEKRSIEIEVTPDYTMPATAVNGKNPGKTVLVTAGVHGDEYPGIAATISLAKKIDPKEVSGRILFIHCVNVRGFYGKSRVVPEDGGNLNACFPGDREGTLSAKIAAYIVENVFSQVDFALDMHSGSISEPLTPCLFYPVAGAVSGVSLEAAKAVDVEYLIASTAKTGLYSYAVSMGIPGMLIERGHSGECRDFWVTDDEYDISRVLNHLGVTDIKVPEIKSRRSICGNTIYLESEVKGLWYTELTAGERVSAGEVLGRVEDFRGEVLREYRAVKDGIVFYFASGMPVEVGSSLVAYGTEFIDIN